MESWPDLFLQLLSAIILHSHDRLSMISVTPFVLPCVSAQGSVSQYFILLAVPVPHVLSHYGRSTQFEREGFGRL